MARRSPVLKLEKDDRLVAMIRSGHEGAFEVLVQRYESRLLGFCTSMLKSRQDAEDVLQEVFVNAHSAMLGDERRINVRPWLYRIARNRCLNHLRKPVPEGTDSMDIHPHMNGATTAERVQDREELRQVLNDVGTLPETQRTALLLREIDQLCYEDIAVAMETTVPAVKSLLVRARITLAESSEARTLSCEEVRVTLAEAAEGLRKASGPVRIHVRNCEPCAGFRDQLRADHKALAAIFPIGPLALLKFGFLAKLFGGGGASAGGGATATAGGTVTAIGGATAGGSATAGGLGAIGGAIGTKAVAGMATAALITAGAVEVSQVTAPSQPAAAQVEQVIPVPSGGGDDEDKGDKRDKWKHTVKAAVGGTALAATTAESAVASEPPAEEAEPVEEETSEEPAAEIIADAEEEITEEFEGDGLGQEPGEPIGSAEPVGREPIDPQPPVLTPPGESEAGPAEPPPEQGEQPEPEPEAVAETEETETPDEDPGDEPENPEAAA